MVNGMPRQAAGKSVCHTGALVVQSLLVQFGDICNLKKGSGNSQRRILRMLEPAPVSVND